MKKDAGQVFSRIRESIRRKTENIRRSVLTIAVAFRHPGLGKWPKILAFLTLAYAFSPIDLVPDFIPVLGLLDDLVILPLLIFLTYRAVPDDVLREAGAVVEKEPPTLRKRWFFVPVILGFWVAAAFFVVRAVVLR